MTTTLDALLRHLQRLRLLEISRGLQTLHQQDPERTHALIEALEPLLAAEVAARADRRIRRRIKDARFVHLQTVDTFDFDHNVSTRKLKKRYLQLLASDMVTQNVGAVFVGPSGTGKSHLARALGVAACQRHQRVLFIPCDSMLNRLLHANSDLLREVNQLTAPALLIIDELVCLQWSPKQADLFLQVIAHRHDAHRPTVVTTNNPIERWDQVFHPLSVAHLIVDCLLKRAEVFHLEGTICIRR